MSWDSGMNTWKFLASKAPTPGGGSAAAVYGAVGTALGEMVGNLTTGKKKFAIYEEEIQKILVRLQEARMDFHPSREGGRTGV